MQRIAGFRGCEMAAITMVGEISRWLNAGGLAERLRGE
jgi:hypothetical protein